MAWQSLSGSLGAGSNGSGNGNGEGQQQVNQPQGTEYTLQGLSYVVLCLPMDQVLIMFSRGDALPTDRVAQARTRSEWVGD
jgi:hypothetical protein